MKEGIVKGTKLYLMLSFLIGMFIILFAINLDYDVFRSAIVFGISSGIFICAVSVFEWIKINNERQCPVCHGKLKSRDDVCRNCGFSFDGDSGLSDKKKNRK